MGHLHSRGITLSDRIISPRLGLANLHPIISPFRPTLINRIQPRGMVDPTPHLRQLLAAREFAPVDQNAPAPAHPDLTPLADHIHSSVQNSDTDPSTATVCTTTLSTMPMIPFSQGRLPRSSGRPRSGAASATVLSEVGLVCVAMEAGSNGPRNDGVKFDARKRHIV